MALEQRFRDEWLVRLVRKNPLIPPGFVEQARTSGAPFFAQALVASGVVTPEVIGRIVRDAYRIEFHTPESDAIDRAVLRLVPERVCRSHTLLPFKADLKSIDVAMANPLDLEAERVVASVTGRAVKSYYCLPAKIEELVARLLAPDALIFELLERVHTKERVEVVCEADGAPDNGTVEPVHGAVVQLVDAILAKAVQTGASDIEIEQAEVATDVRYRVDGRLRNSMVLPRYLGAGPVVSRIKIITNLDVADRRRAQDGRATIRVGVAEIGLRVSTLPTALGEKVAIRILDERSSFTPLVEIPDARAADALATAVVPTNAVVLVAIGDQTVRTRFSTALSAIGYRVMAVADGPSALIRLQQAPEVLVGDVELPGLTGLGLELFRRARSEMALSALVVVAVGREGEETERIAAHAGADEFVALTATPAVIAGRVKAALGRRGDFSPTADIMRPRIPANEGARLAALRATKVLDTPPEERFDEITRRAQRMFDVPIAMVSLVDADRQWFKSRLGVETTQTPREVAFCAHAINGGDIFVVPDAALDPRFADNPLVRGEPHVRFYAGYPLNAAGGEKLGAFCIIDRRPRQLSQAGLQNLRDLGHLVERELMAGTPQPA